MNIDSTIQLSRFLLDFQSTDKSLNNWRCPPRRALGRWPRRLPFVKSMLPPPRQALLSSPRVPGTLLLNTANTPARYRWRLAKLFPFFDIFGRKTRIHQRITLNARFSVLKSAPFQQPDQGAYIFQRVGLISMLFISLF